MAKKKRVKKKSAKRATSKRKKRAAPKRAAAKRSAVSHSVDSLLKRFAKERSAKEVQLATLRTKKHDLEEKTRKQREQIAKMADQEKKAEGELAQLDARRDSEVSQLLAKLGIDLGKTAAHNSKHDRSDHSTSSGAKRATERPALSTPERNCCPSFPRHARFIFTHHRLRQQILHDLPVHIREPITAALMLVGEPFVVNSEQVK